MNKTYEAPKLTVYGNIEQITQANQTTSAQDNVFLNGNPIGGLNTTGSQNAVIVLCGQAGQPACTTPLNR